MKNGRLNCYVQLLRSVDFRDNRLRPLLPLTLMAVAVGPADGTRALPEEAPGVDLLVRVPAQVVVPEASTRVLAHVVWEVGPLQAGGA